MDSISEAKVKTECNSIEKALKVLNAALFKNPENLIAQENILILRRSLVKDLIEKLKSVVKKDDFKIMSSRKKIEKVEELILKDRIAEANKLIQEAAELNPSSDEVILLKGYALYMSGSLKPAIPLLKEVESLNPNNKKAKKFRDNAEKLEELINEMANQTKEDKNKESVKLLTEALAIDADNFRINQTLFFQRSLAHFSLGNTSEAFADFKAYEILKKKNFVQL